VQLYCVVLVVSHSKQVLSVSCGNSDVGHNCVGSIDDEEEDWAKARERDVASANVDGNIATIV
jgi:hypothetical protein